MSLSSNASRFTGLRVCWIAQASKKTRRDALKKVFSGVSKFPRLERLRFDFHESYHISLKQYAIPSHLLRLQFDVLGALSAHPTSPLVALSLNNLMPLPNEIYMQRDFCNVLRSLKSLRISARSYIPVYNPEDYSEWDPPNIYYPVTCFWRDTVSHILSNAAALTSLTVSGGQWDELRVFAAMPFETTMLPHLASLSLHHFHFISQWTPLGLHGDLVDFILRHKATLKDLQLDACPVAIDRRGGSPCLWHVVLKCFMDELCVLQHFALTNSSALPTEPNESGFVRDPRFFYQRISEPEEGVFDLRPGLFFDGEAKDVGALEDLLAVVEARRLDSGTT